eukprot:COSAG01_NODE_3554_length_5940_cov_77.779319_3_plen_116_part_00
MARTILVQSMHANVAQEKTIDKLCVCVWWWSSSSSSSPTIERLGDLFVELVVRRMGRGDSSILADRTALSTGHRYKRLRRASSVAGAIWQTRLVYDFLQQHAEWSSCVKCILPKR